MAIFEQMASLLQESTTRKIEESIIKIEEIEEKLKKFENLYKEHEIK